VVSNRANCRLEMAREKLIATLEVMLRLEIRMRRVLLELCEILNADVLRLEMRGEGEGGWVWCAGPRVLLRLDVHAAVCFVGFTLISNVK
jgi:hypothetical protein